MHITQVWTKKIQTEPQAHTKCHYTRLIGPFKIPTGSMWSRMIQVIMRLGVGWKNNASGISHGLCQRAQIFLSGALVFVCQTKAEQ